MLRTCLLGLVGLVLGAQFRMVEIGKVPREVKSVRVEDVNSDGKPDVVVTTGGGSIWYQNPTWQPREIRAKQPAGAAIIGRVNRYRVEARHGEALTILEEPRPKLDPQGPPPPEDWRTPAGTVWPTTFSDAALKGERALVWADFDGDGSDELAFGGKDIGLLKRDGEGSWRRIASFEAAEQLASGDLNGDGKPDLVAVAARSVRVYWNQWRPLWVRHEVFRGERAFAAVGLRLNSGGRGIISNVGKRTLLLGQGENRLLHDGIGLIHAAVMDVDGDGDEDFIGADYSPGHVFWLEQPAKPLEQPWQYHLIDKTIDGVHGLHVADVDGDGRPDLIANSGQPKGEFANSIVWLKALDGGKSWRREVFAKGDAPGLSHYHGAGDLNGDGKTDIVSAAKVGKDGMWFAWWEQGASGWTKHVLATNENGATNPLVADLNGDGKMDVVATRGHGIGLLWFEGPAFNKHEIDTTLFGPHSLAIGDIDGDGDIDAVTCAKDSFVLAWFENDGKGNFTKRVIHENQAAYDIRLVDLDMDGDLDILVAGQNSANVVWWENQLQR